MRLLGCVRRWKRVVVFPGYASFSSSLKLSVVYRLVLSVTFSPYGVKDIVLTLIYGTFVVFVHYY